jgi:hypothetical protein
MSTLNETNNHNENKASKQISSHDPFYGLDVSVILPIYNDGNNIWKYFLDTMLPSLENFRGLPLTLLICFQRFTPGHVEGIIRLVKQTMGNSVKVIYRSDYYPPPVSMCRIREDIACLNPNVDIYICWDDDMQFFKNISLRYREIIQYMVKYPRCGAVMATNHERQNKSLPSIDRRDHAMWATYGGLFLRNIKDQNWRFAPEDSHKLKGGLEETYSIFSRMDLGYWAAKAYYVPYYHEATFIGKKFTRTANRKNKYPKIEDIHYEKNLELIPLIKTKWNDPYWTYEYARTPRGINISEIETDINASAI